MMNKSFLFSLWIVIKIPALEWLSVDHAWVNQQPSAFICVDSEEDMFIPSAQ
jgi:hypothetical protein